jgi:hypothetical protein
MTAGSYFRLRLVSVCLLAAVPLIAGCAGTSKWYSQQKLDQGYTVVLPGILGRGPWDDCLASSLNSADVPTAIELYDWTKGPIVFVYNGLSQKYNRKQAQKIADRIVSYRAAYPGRPVHLVGHSGGASLAVLVLEALPPGERVNTAVLMGSGLARNYDLSSAMTHTEEGIHNYYSNLDVVVSQLYVGVVAALAGRPKLTSGAFGFRVPTELDDNRRRLQYEEQLVQHKYCFDMFCTGHLGGHFGWTWSPFVRKEVAPLLAEAKPANSGTARAAAFVITDEVSDQRFD